MDTLTKEQQEALDYMRKGENVFISGKAGTGKSYILNIFIKEMEELNKNILVTAPTGIAAINIGGVTLHRTFHLSTEPQIKTFIPKVNDEVLDSDIIVIDEISMCRVDLFDTVIRHISTAERQSRRRKQIIVVGDFFQLPPVTTKDDLKILKDFYKDYDKGFAFESDYWNDLCFKKIILKKIMRQDDSTFIEQLNRARIGDISCVSYFNTHASKELIENGIILCARNKTALQINNEELEKINEESHIYEAIIEGEVKSSDKPTFDSIELKVGARVLMIVNDVDRNQYQNGSLGTVVALKKSSVLIYLDNTNKVEVGYYEWAVENYTVVEEQNDQGTYKKISKQKIGSFQQLPLKLAYAITIHKSQGQTYDKVNLIPYCFDYGQLYVALSRVKSIEGLCLIEVMKKEYLKCNDKVKKFYGIDYQESVRRKEILANFGKDVLLMDKSIKKQFPKELLILMEEVYKKIQNE